MTGPLKRYAITNAAGLFAKPWPGYVEWVPLERAKLWRTKGHVTLHLQAVGTYPDGAVLVEVSIVPSVEPLMVVAEYQAERAAEAAKRDAARAKEHAARELESARERYEALAAKAAR